MNDLGPYNFIFDTGGVNVLTPATAQALGLKPEGKIEGRGTGSGQMDFGLVKVASLGLGAAEIRNQLFLVAPFGQLASSEGVEMAGMVGFETLRRFVTLDYGHQTTYVKPVTVAVDDLDTFDRAGLWINQAPEGFAVVDVTKGAPADEAGLKGGRCHCGRERRARLLAQTLRCPPGTAR